MDIQIHLQIFIVSGKNVGNFTKLLQFPAIFKYEPNIRLQDCSPKDNNTMKTAHMITILLAGTSLRVFAQMPQGPPPDPIAMALDKNHDGELSSREIKNAAKSLLKLDKNRDKSLNAEEIGPEPPKGERRRKKDEAAQNPPPAAPPSKLLEALDTDSTGDLSTEELKSASENLAKLDQDGDGELSNSESGIQLPENRGGPNGGGQNGGGPPQNGPAGGPPPQGPRR